MVLTPEEAHMKLIKRTEQKENIAKEIRAMIPHTKDFSKRIKKIRLPKTKYSTTYLKKRLRYDIPKLKKKIHTRGDIL